MSAAKVVTKRKRQEWAADPLVPAIEKLATTKHYNGAVHLEAASALENANDHHAAFDALAAAAYWQAQAAGACDGNTLSAARTLARRAQWLEIADSLDQLYKARAELDAEGLL